MGEREKKADATDRFYRAVATYLEAKGYNVTTVGGVKIYHPLGGFKFRFELIIGVTGMKKRARKR